ASLVRSVAAHQRGEQELDFTAAFRTVTQDLPSVVGTSFVVAAMGIVGLMMCYLPTLLVAMLFGFAINVVALHRAGALPALRTSFRHAMAHPGFHAPYVLLFVVINLVANNIP